MTLTLFITIPITLAIALQNDLYALYLQRFVEPAIERNLGFVGGEIAVTSGGVATHAYGMVSVVPGGVFDRAGVKAGDRPVGYAHGMRSGFISELQHARGAEVKISFVSGGKDTAMAHRREIVIALPR